MRRTCPLVTRRSDVTSITSRPLRADATRNYDAIVQASLAVFVEQGTQGSLDDIATRAGVANATLYRRFPPRGGLLLAPLRPPVAGTDENAGPPFTSQGPGAPVRGGVFSLAPPPPPWPGPPRP